MKRQGNSTQRVDTFRFDGVTTQVAQAGNKSIDEHRHCCVTFEIKGFVWGKVPIVSVTYGFLSKYNP